MKTRFGRPKNNKNYTPVKKLKNEKIFSECPRKGNGKPCKCPGRK